MNKKVIIDTDPGIDDALALLLALNSPELEILAVTTTCGNVPVETATRNLLTVFSHSSRSNLPVVAKGAEKPLKKEPYFATYFYGKNGLGRYNNKHQIDNKDKSQDLSGECLLDNRSAQEEIIHQIKNSAQPVTLISLGPLTNLAKALEKDREAMNKLNHLIVMGGAIEQPGNITPVAEFNIHFDPHAAREIFCSGLPITMVGLDVTRKARISRSAFVESISAREPRTRDFLHELTTDLFDTMQEIEGLASIPLHDPLAVAVAMEPDLVSSSFLHVDIETDGRLTQGMTVADRRPFRENCGNKPNTSVCTDLNTEGFLELFKERVLCPE